MRQLCCRTEPYRTLPLSPHVSGALDGPAGDALAKRPGGGGWAARPHLTADAAALLRLRHVDAVQLDALKPAQSGAAAPEPQRFSVQHRPGVVVSAGMLGVRILREDDELTGIGGPVPVAERVQVERAPQRLRRRGRLLSRERVAVPDTPPALHIGLHRSRRVRGDVTVALERFDELRTNTPEHKSP